MVVLMILSVVESSLTFSHIPRMNLFYSYLRLQSCKHYNFVFISCLVISLFKCATNHKPCDFVSPLDLSISNFDDQIVFPTPIFMVAFDSYCTCS